MFDGLIEISACLVSLLDALEIEFLVFGLGEFPGQFVRDFPRMRQDIAVIDGQECVELGDPIAHVHGDAAHGLALGKDEVLLDEVVQGGEFRLVEVMLGDGNVLFAHLGSAPMGQAHVGPGAVRAGMDDFRRRLAGNGPVHFVLNGLEKLDADRLGGIVINAGGVNIRDLLVKPPLRGANVLNPPEELIKVIEGLIGVFEALVIEDKAFDNEFAELLCGPDAEAGGHGAFDAVTDGNNGVEIVIFNRTGHLPGPFLAN